MGYYEEAPPRHGHRTPAELAEDEKIAAVHGHVCSPRHMEETGPVGIESERHSHVTVPLKQPLFEIQSASNQRQADHGSED